MQIKLNLHFWMALHSGEQPEEITSIPAYFSTHLAE